MGRTKSPCILCLSIYRSELSALYTQGVSTVTIWEKYKEKLKYKAGKKAFYQLIRRHVTMNHSEKAVILPEESRGVTSVTIEKFGQRMLEMGMQKIDTMTPETIQLKDVISAQKLVLDSKKIKIGEEAMLLMMRKMFAPPELNTEVIDGTTV